MKGYLNILYVVCINKAFANTCPYLFGTISRCNSNFVQKALPYVGPSSWNNF